MTAKNHLGDYHTKTIDIVMNYKLIEMRNSMSNYILLLPVGEVVCNKK